MSLVFSLGIATRHQTGTSAPAPATRPVNTVLPVITGTARQGQVLTADTGGWMGNPTSFARQWRRNGVAIAGAVAASYTLVAADVGSTISVAVTAANAQGSTTATSEATAPVLADAPDRFIVAMQGQSGAKYLMTMTRSGEFNPTGVDRSGTTIAGSWGNAVEMVAVSPGAAPTVVDRLIDQTNYTTASGGYIVSRSAAAVARFMRFMDPTREPVVLTLAKSGESMAGLLNDADNDVDGTNGYGWDWEDYNHAVDHVEATYGPIDLLVTHWYGTAPSQIVPAHWMGELADGTPHILGRDANNAAGEPGVDHYLFDIKAAPGIGEGTFPYDQGMKLAYSVHPNPNVDPALRATVTAFFNDPRLSPMNLGNVIAPTSAHMLDSNVGGAPISAMSIMGPAILKALGRDDPQPAITGMMAANDGSYIDVTVNLPNGGRLTTVRTQRSIPAPSSPAATYLPVYGFTVAAPGQPASTMVNLPRSGWNAVITNTGTGTAPARTGTVRLTPVTPVKSGTQIAYRMGGTGTEGGDAIPQDQYPVFNFLIEEVPALMEPGAEFPFPGYAVQPMNSMTTLSVGSPLAPLASGMVDGATPSEPAGLAAGQRVVLIAVSGSSHDAQPSLPSGWTNHTITGAGPTGTNGQRSFRVCSRLWQSGDTMPTFTNASSVSAHAFSGGFTVGKVLSVFGGASAVLDAPAITPLTGTEARHMIFASGRSGSGFTASALSGAGFTRLTTSPSNPGRTSAYSIPDPVTSIGAVTLPALGSSNGGGALTIEIREPS
jgi:hypothetical protein